LPLPYFGAAQSISGAGGRVWAAGPSGILVR
jgi:hypothetical protein